MQRLKTDYIDSYYLHGVAGDQIAMLRDPGVKAAFEELKRKGKILFCGLSCHDARLPEILTAAAEAGWMDQVMFKYNFRDVGGKDRHDDLQRAVDLAAKANLGLVAMKTQGGAINFPDKMAKLQEKGFKKEVAAIKTVWLDGRIQVVVSEMTNRSDLRENVAATQDQKLSSRDAGLLEEYRRTTAHLYCHGCGNLCETAAKGVPVATVLRYLRYYEVYGKRQERGRCTRRFPRSPAISPPRTSPPPPWPAPTACRSPIWSNAPTAGSGSDLQLEHERNDRHAVDGAQVLRLLRCVDRRRSRGRGLRK